MVVYIIIGDVVALLLSFIFGGFLGFFYNSFILGDFYDAFSSIDNMYSRAVVFCLLSCTVLVLVAIDGRYIAGRSFWNIFTVSAKAVFIVFLLDVVFQYTTKEAFSRIWLVGSWGAAFVLLPLTSLFVRSQLIKQDKWARPIVIVEATLKPDRLSETLTTEWPSDYRIIGQHRVQPSDMFHLNQNLSQIITQSLEHKATVMISLDASAIAQVLPFCRKLDASKVEYFLVPDFGKEGRRGIFQEMHFENGVALVRGNYRVLEGMNKVLKRSLDVVLSLVFLAAASIPMLVVALIVRSDGGPVFFAHERIGFGGKKFKCLKFRTMKTNADEILKKLLESDPAIRNEWEEDFKLRDDPRVISIGSFLRKYSVDELPQFINVLRGDMSIVGPRPVVEAELEKYYGEETEVYTSVYPGITGLWQVSGRNDTGYQKRVDLDVRYARSWSVVKDIKIILLTPAAVLFRRGAY